VKKTIVNCFEIRPCKSVDLLGVIADCISDVMISESNESRGMIFPTELSLGYSDEGGLGLAIGPFFITCDNSPPNREDVIRIVKEAYEIMLVSIAGLLVRIGEIKVIPLARQEECNLEVEILLLQ
jgi:hypothetical protein